MQPNRALNPAYDLRAYAGAYLTPAILGKLLQHVAQGLRHMQAGFAISDAGPIKHAGLIRSYHNTVIYYQMWLQHKLYK